MYIYKAAVIGAGAMGAEIAQTITFSGIPVLLKDVDQAMVDKGLAVIRKIYQRRVDRGKMTADELEKKMALVTGVTDYEGFKDVDLVVEAVPEKMALKQKIFKELDETIQGSAILATNTSSLSISAMGSATKRPHKVIGMHFFYPAHIMKLVEVVPGLETDEARLVLKSARRSSPRVLSQFSKSTNASGGRFSMQSIRPPPLLMHWSIIGTQ